MLIKEREMFVKEGMIFINRQRPIEVSRIIGGGEPVKTCNELGSTSVRRFSNTHPTLLCFVNIRNLPSAALCVHKTYVETLLAYS